MEAAPRNLLRGRPQLLTPCPQSQLLSGSREEALETKSAVHVEVWPPHVTALSLSVPACKVGLLGG